jgi:HTH-type transcriptional regulator/antitoxin HigA
MIKTDGEYRAALQAIRPFFQDEPQPGTPEADEFDRLFNLIEAYEAKAHPMIDAPSRNAR